MAKLPAILIGANANWEEIRKAWNDLHEENTKSKFIIKMLKEENEEHVRNFAILEDELAAQEIKTVKQPDGFVASCHNCGSYISAEVTFCKSCVVVEDQICQIKNNT